MIRRSVAALLALILILCAIPAFADTEKMYISKTSVQVYYSPSTSGKKYTKLSYGEEVTVSARNSTWAQLTNSAGAIGYCKVSNLTTTDPNVEEAVVFYVKSNSAKVYKKTSTTSTVVETLSYGAAVRAVAITPDKVWMRIESGNGYGYIKCSALMKNKPAQSAVVYVSATTATVRKNASSSAAKAGTAYFGEEYTLTKLSGDWAYISNGIVSGWCKKSALSLNDQVGEKQTWYVVANGSTALYGRTGSSLGEVAKVNNGDMLNVVAFTSNDKFAMVDYNGAYVYIGVEHLSKTEPEEEAPVEPEQPGDTGSEDNAGEDSGNDETGDNAADEEQKGENSITAYVTATLAVAYKTPASSAKQVGTVYFGEVLTCTEVNGKWAKVKNSAGEGWVLKEALSTSNPLGSAKTYYVRDTGAKIYSKPKSSATSLDKLNAGATIEVVGTTKDGEWRCINYNGGIAYVYASAVTTEKPEDPVTVYVRYDIVTAYKTSSSSSQKVGEVCYGEELSRLRVSGDWALVSNSSGQGWVKTDSLTTSNPNTYNSELYVRDDEAYMYNKPSASSTKGTMLSKGEAVVGVAVTPDSNWVRVKNGDGYAYMKAAALTSEKPNGGYSDPYIGTASSTIERVCAIACAQYGKPYVYAEEGPDSYDCTGLMWYAYSKGAGIYLKRTGYEQGYDSKYARVNSVSELKRGDIVVFNTIDDGENDMSDHTGLYLGGGLFIHSSSGAMKVIVSDVTTGYYNRKFSWGLRIIE